MRPQSLRFSSVAFSVDPLSVGLDQFTCTAPDRCYTQEIGHGFKSLVVRFYLSVSIERCRKRAADEPTHSLRRIFDT